MYKLIIKPAAVEMTEEAYDWYNNQQQDLGEVFIAALGDCFERITQHPKAYSNIKKNYRQARLKKFPYVIVFEIFKTDVVVFSVFHTSRNPKHKI